MLTITNYVRPQTLDEAYELCQKRNNVVLGGMLWLKMQNRIVGTAIDLCDLGLNTIEETEDAWLIGSYVSLRTLETHAGLNTLTQGAMADALKSIVGVQFRNVATLGGSLFGRFGFSDVLTLFQVLDARIELHHLGTLSVAEFAALPRTTRDILVRVIVPKAPARVVYLSQRNTATDFPTLTCAVALRNGQVVCSVGATPYAAGVYTDETGILNDALTADSAALSISEETAAAFGASIADQVKFGSDLRCGAEYRKRVCAVLVRRALMKL